MVVTTPIWLTLRSSISMWSGRASAIVTSPPVMPAPATKVAATTRSGTTACRVGMQLVDPLDLNPRGAGPADHGAHGAQHGGQVDDLGLLGRVLDHRGALGQHGGHEQVVGGRVAGVLQHHLGADQPAALDVAPHLAVGDLEAGPHGGQPVDVEVDRPVAEVVAPGQRHVHLAAAGQEEAEDDHRGPHALHQLVGGHRVEVLRRRGGDGQIAVAQPLHLGPHGPQHLGHGLHVVDEGHVGQHRAPLGQQAGHHQLEGRVLGPAGPHRPAQGAVGPDDDLLHICSTASSIAPGRRRRAAHSRRVTN